MHSMHLVLHVALYHEQLLRYKEKKIFGVVFTKNKWNSEQRWEEQEHSERQ